MDFRRNKGESELEYIYRIGSQKDVIGTWTDVADIINSELGYNYSECKYRKQLASFRQIYDANKEKLMSPDAQIAEMEQRKLELQREARKFYDERQALNRVVTAQARNESLYECIRDAARRLNETAPLIHRTKNNTTTLYSNNEAVLCLSDWHYGMRCDNIFNTFNP